MVSFNSRETLRDCVEPLCGQDGITVIVVDNASSDGSVDSIIGLPALVLRRSVNGGFASGCNAGWRAARHRWVVFLDDDVVPDPDWFDRLATDLTERFDAAMQDDLSTPEAMAALAEEPGTIDAVTGIRPGVESVIPPRRRRVSRTFTNSRVPDKAVLPTREAARQTRDFITLQTRNDIAQDDWLRATAEGPPGDDFFASFSCYEIDFPAEKSREFLANRLARDCLERLRHSGRSSTPPVSKELFRPPELAQASQEARERLRQAVTPVAQQVAERIDQRVELTLDRTRRELREAFDQAFARQLAAEIQRHWRELTENRGVMDALVDRLRRSTSGLLSERVIEVRKESDRLIEELAGRGGLQRALAGFQELRDAAQEQLQSAEDQRRHRERVAERHTTPKTRPIETARQEAMDLLRSDPGLIGAEHAPLRAAVALRQ